MFATILGIIYIFYEIGKKYAEAFEILRLEMGFGETCSIL